MWARQEPFVCERALSIRSGNHAEISHAWLCQARRRRRCSCDELSPGQGDGQRDSKSICRQPGCLAGAGEMEGAGICKMADSVSRAWHCHGLKETADLRARSQVSPRTTTSEGPENVSRMPVQPGCDSFNNRRSRPDESQSASAGRSSRRGVAIVRSVMGIG